MIDGDVSLPLVIAGANITAEQSKLTVERLYINFPIASGSTDHLFPSVSNLDDFLKFKALVIMYFC